MAQIGSVGYRARLIFVIVHQAPRLPTNFGRHESGEVDERYKHTRVGAIALITSAMTASVPAPLAEASKGNF